MGALLIDAGIYRYKLKSCFVYFFRMALKGVMCSLLEKNNLQIYVKCKGFFETCSEGANHSDEIHPMGTSQARTTVFSQATIWKQKLN